MKFAEDTDGQAHRCVYPAAMDGMKSQLLCGVLSIDGACQRHNYPSSLHDMVWPRPEEGVWENSALLGPVLLQMTCLQIHKLLLLRSILYTVLGWIGLNKLRISQTVSGCQLDGDKTWDRNPILHRDTWYSGIHFCLGLFCLKQLSPDYDKVFWVYLHFLWQKYFLKID